eukprot:491893-Hanusia_phi.AAC.1
MGERVNEWRFSPRRRSIPKFTEPGTRGCGWFLMCAGGGHGHPAAGPVCSALRRRAGQACPADDDGLGPWHCHGPSTVASTVRYYGGTGRQHLLSRPRNAGTVPYQ